jgi:hypothetical protein
MSRVLGGLSEVRYEPRALLAGRPGLSGIDHEMFIGLSSHKRPAGSFDSNGRVPSGVGMKILTGSKSSPAMSYDFTVVQPPTTPVGPRQGNAHLQRSAGSHFPRCCV